MSKAFTKEDVSGDEIIVPARRPLPDGAPNYVTPRGLERLRSEIRRLQQLRSAPEAPIREADRLRTVTALNASIRDIEERLASAVLVDPAQPRDDVRFGARVTVRDESGASRTFEIVGVDEADLSEGRLAFVAPLARALLGKRVGEAITLRTPRGEEELEVVSVAYCVAR